MKGHNCRNCLAGALFLLFLVGIQNIAATELDDTPEGIIPEEPVPIPLPEEYLTSRFRQPCLQTVPNLCRCTNLWDSPCNCDDRDRLLEQSFENTTSCPCQHLCEELWTSNRLLSMPMRYVCKIPQIRKYSLRVFIGSKERESAETLLYMKRLAEVMGPALELSVNYVNYLQGERLSSPRGPAEVLGNMIGKCAMNLYPEPHVYLPFLACMAMNTTLVPQNFWNCTRLHSVEHSKIRRCVDTQGESLLANDLIATQHYRVQSPPRVFMDERYFNPGRNNNYESYESALCYVFANATRPFPWFIFFIMGSLIIMILILFFVFKRWSHTSFVDNLQSLFLWNSAPNDPADTLLYFRAYGLIDDDDEMDEPRRDEPRRSRQEEPEAASQEQESRARRRRRRRRREENQNPDETEPTSRSRRRRSRRQRHSSRRTRHATDEPANEEVNEPETAELDLSEAPLASSSNAPEPAAAHELELDTVPDYYYSSDDDEEPGSQSRLLLPH